MSLTLAEANRMVQAALAKAQEMNIKLSVAVCDAGGHLLAFNRMEGAIWVSVAAAQGKAVAATAFGRPSAATMGKRVSPRNSGLSTRAVSPSGASRMST